MQLGATWLRGGLWVRGEYGCPSKGTVSKIPRVCIYNKTQLTLRLRPITTNNSMNNSNKYRQANI